MMIDSEKFIKRLESIQDDYYEYIHNAMVKCYKDVDANRGSSFSNMRWICKNYIDSYEKYNDQICEIGRMINEINNEVKIEQEQEGEN